MVKFIILSFIFSFLLTGCSLQNKNENTSDFNAEQLSANINIPSNTSQPTFENKTQPVPENKSETVPENVPQQPPIETTISEFSTKIYDKTPSRLNNLRIACSKLNNTIIEPSENFSFCKTVGPSSEEDGYLKADGLDSEGNTIKVLGGGKCQISSTLYNAVLAIPELEVTERHTHSKTVPYVEKGKDATVAYDYLDLKFTNKLTSKIKIYASANNEIVTIKLVTIS